MKASKRDIDPGSKTEEIFFDNGDTLPARFNVDSRVIKEGKKIGEGNWIVHEAEWLGRKVAVKKFHVQSTFGNVSLTSKEVNRMLGLRHPNVLKLLGFYLTAQKDLVLDCTMIMELMDCDLEDYIGRGALSDDQVVYLIAEVARGMNHIHKMGCFHRDLKPKNVLLRKSIVSGFHVDVKIADFGSSELMRVGNIDPKAGTIGYKAPEQFDSAPLMFPDKADVFGFGALCFKILTGKKPYESPKNVREVIKQIDRATSFHRNLPANVVEMIWKCLDLNPDLRPVFEDISRILDGALSSIREKMAPPLSVSTSLCSDESMLRGVQGYGHLESILHRMGLAKEYGVHFIPYEELVVIRVIGAGGSAKIYEVKWKGVFYALKVEDGGDSGMPYSYMGKSYFQTFPKLSHKNIATFMGYSVTPKYKISIVMEVLEMDLVVALDLYRSGRRKSIRLDIHKRLMIVREIAEGMKYLHDQGVVHGDLKPGNVVLSALNTNQMTVKLIDFASKGLSIHYMAPECWLNRDCRFSGSFDLKKADVFSFGIVCNEIIAGVQSFEDMSLREFREAIFRGERPPISIGTSPEIVCLIRSCWSGDPQERPNFTEICERLSRAQQYQPCHGQENLEGFAQRCCFL